MNENIIKSISGIGKYQKITEKLDDYSSRDIFYPVDTTSSKTAPSLKTSKTPENPETPKKPENSETLKSSDLPKKPFLVLNKSTFELRTDQKLGKLLTEKYESVMQSRYFGRGGIEIVKDAHQLEPSELADLIRLSYNLTKSL